MKKSVPPKPTAREKRPVSDAELEQLLTPQEKELLQGADQGFRYRHMVMTLVMLTLIVRLVFFSATVGDSFKAQPGMPDLATYSQYRGLYVLLASAVYVLSYVRDWYFDRVVLVILTMAVFGLVMDFFNVYRLLNDPTSPSTLFFLLLRVVVIVCLFINVLRAQRAPPAPRGFWS